MQYVAILPAVARKYVHNGATLFYTIADIYKKIKYERRNMINTEWIHCPICGGKIHSKMCEDTEMRKFPFFSLIRR